MFERLKRAVRQAQWKIHTFALGMTLALGAQFVGQGCAGGQ
jgi:hypothetical protein